ncbi:thy-1 membrane glycoprotein [Mustelus asterias]
MMKQLLILSVLAVLPMVEGLEITRIDACTTKTNDLQLDCNYKKTDSGNVKYEWSLYTTGNKTIVINSSINPQKESATFKNRATVNVTDTLLRLIITGFGVSMEGNYTCTLNLDAKAKNATISVEHDVATCGTPGLVLSSPWMLSLLLSLTVLQALDALPGGSSN